MRHLNVYGGQLTDTTDRFNDELYWLTIMGTPSATDPWGWQFEGHHLVINYFVRGDQVVMTPTFMGSEPTVADYDVDSPYEGVTIFQDELAAGYALIRSLSADQQSVVIVQGTPSDLLAGAYSDNKVMPYEGHQGHRPERRPAGQVVDARRAVRRERRRRSREGHDGRDQAAQGRDPLLLARHD